MLVFKPFQWEICHNTLQQSWITIKSQHFHQKKNQTSVLSIWIRYRINWIISTVHRDKKCFFIFLASDKLLAALGSGIGTGSVFCHSSSFQDNVSSKEGMTQTFFFICKKSKKWFLLLCFCPFCVNGKGRCFAQGKCTSNSRSLSEHMYFE